MQPIISIPARRKNWASSRYKLVTDFTGTWTPSGGSTALETKFGKAAAQSRRFTPAGNHTIDSPTGIVNKPLAQLKQIGLWVYVEPAGGAYSAIRITFGQGSYANSMSWLWAGAIMREGWNFLVVDVLEAGTAWPAPAVWTTNGTGSFTTAFDRIQVQINSTGVNYYLGGLYCLKPKTAIIFGLDNGPVVDGGPAELLHIFNTIYPKFSGFGWSGYLAIPHISYAVNLSVPRTTTMYNAGWEVWNHSTTHTNFKTLTNAQILADIATQKNYFKQNGWTRTLNFGAYPENQVDDRVASYLRSIGEKFWRGIAGRYCFGHDKFMFPESMLQFPSVDASPMSVVEMQNITNAAIRMEASGVCFFTHGLDTVPGALYMGTTEFNSICDWWRTKELDGSIEILTGKQYLDGLQNPV